MEHLTQSRAQSELSHTLMTQLEARHQRWTTQQTHRVIRTKVFHQQKQIYSIIVARKLGLLHSALSPILSHSFSQNNITTHIT